MEQLQAQMPQLLIQSPSYIESTGTNTVNANRIIKLTQLDIPPLNGANFKWTGS